MSIPINNKDLKNVKINKILHSIENSCNRLNLDKIFDRMANLQFINIVDNGKAIRLTNKFFNVLKDKDIIGMGIIDAKRVCIENNCYLTPTLIMEGIVFSAILEFMPSLSDLNPFDLEQLAENGIICDFCGIYKVLVYYLLEYDESTQFGECPIEK